MDPLRLLRPLVHAAGPELQVTGRELLGVVVAAERAALYPRPPAWVRELCIQVGTREGVSPALLEAVSGELTSWDPGHGHQGGPRIGLMGLPVGLTLVNGGRDLLVAHLEDLERRDTAAAHRIARNVSRAAAFIRQDSARLELVQVLEYYAGLGRSEGDPSGRELARRIVGRYLWALLERLPRDRAAELLESFEAVPAPVAPT